jgi:Subtilisin inhibitor-like
VRQALLAACVLALAACGGSADEPPANAAATTDLEIEVYPEGAGGPFAKHELRCDPAGGTLADVESACAQLAGIGPEAFDPVPADAMCTEQFGGPQFAKVNGTLRGETIGAQFTRVNGCEIARWDELAFLFPEDDGS